MRKNTRDTFNAFLNDQPKGKPGSAIWTDGHSIYSYGTCLVAVLPEEEGRWPLKFVLNRSKYSVTTTIHQNGLAVLLHNYALGETWTQGRGATADQLREAVRSLRPTQPASDFKHVERHGEPDFQ